MEYSVSEAKKHLSQIIQWLLDEKEDSIIISKNGKPVVMMSLFHNKNPMRIGAAKTEMKDFDISLEKFNSIPIDNFGL